MTQYYAYIYHDGDVPIYVGKGKGVRVSRHLKRKDKHPLTQKLTKMKREGREPRIQIIDAPDEAAAFEMEELLITMIGRKDLGLGPLLNLTDGGEGPSGVIRSAESRAKMTSGLFKGRAHSDETRAKMSVSHANMSAETRAKMSVSHTGMSRSEETKAKLSSLRSKPCTIDGITIYNSRKEMRAILGQGKNGSGSPNFKYVEVSNDSES